MTTRTASTKAIASLATTLIVGIVAASCGKSDPGNLGQLQVALSLPGGVTVNSVAWRVLSSSSAVLASGTINTSNPNATPSVNVSLPAGTGDTVSMTAMTSQGTSCSGTSSPFNVVAGQASAVSVNIACGNASPDAGVGSVIITGTVVAGDNCPALTAWEISPQQTSANGGTIDVEVSASDADMGETLSYAWTATAGSFASASSATTTYTCGAAGEQTLTVTVTDNHTPTACSVAVSFPPVRCL